MELLSKTTKLIVFIYDRKGAKIMMRKHIVLIIAGILLFVGSYAVAQFQTGVLTSTRAAMSGSSNLVYMTPAGAGAGVVTPVAYYYWHHHWYRHHHPHARVCRSRGWAPGHYNKYGRWVHGHHYCRLWANAHYNRYGRLAGGYPAYDRG